MEIQKLSLETRQAIGAVLEVEALRLRLAAAEQEFQYWSCQIPDSELCAYVYHVSTEKQQETIIMA